MKMLENNNLTRREVAERCNTSTEVVDYVCRKYGIKRERTKKYRLLSDTDWLYKKLVEEQRTYQDVASLIGCTHQRVQQRVREMGWSNLRRKIKSKHQEVIDAIRTDNLTRQQAAERCNVTKQVVNYVCRKYGINAPRPTTPLRYPLLADENWLYEKFITEQRTYEDVAAMIGCTPQHLHRRTRELDWMEKGPPGGNKRNQRRRNKNEAPSQNFR